MYDEIFIYNKKKGKYRANKVSKETIYYLGVAKICPRCKNYIQGYPAISRVDNRTEICSNCGTLEALEMFKQHNKKEVKNEKKIQKAVRPVLRRRKRR